MEKIIKMNGYVYSYNLNDKKGFETFYNMGKDPDDPRWKEGEDLEIVEKGDIIEVVPKKGKTNKKEDEK
jgi:hypothetical protein